MENILGQKIEQKLSAICYKQVTVAWVTNPADRSCLNVAPVVSELGKYCMCVVNERMSKHCNLT